MTDDVRVIIKDLPTKVRGFCYHDNDDQCYIVLNAKMNREQQNKTYQHEMKHIENGDMYNQDYREYAK